VAERVPAGDHGLRVGDRVFGMARTHGSYAEHTAISPAATMEPLANDVIDALHAAHPDRVHAVLDLVSSADAIKRDAEVIRPGGRLVSTIFTAGRCWRSSVMADFTARPSSVSSICPAQRR
jgi:hypothetical protein